MLDEIKVEVLKHPTDEDWLWCKTCTLNTIGKKTAQMPTEEWKRKILDDENNTIRELRFGIRMTVPYYVSVH